jgi:hypothetical protein
MWSDSVLTPFKLPARGHALARLGNGRIALMGRRPGLFSSIVDPDKLSEPPTIFEPAKDCRFAGHATVSPDGAALVTSEFDANTIEARIVSRDPGTGVQRALWRLKEIEPHELLFARQGTRLVVALGGLIKDGGVAGPAFNPDGVRSAVVELDPLSGAVLARHALAASLATLSMRHLALSPQGDTVAVAAQDQDLGPTRPLVALLPIGKELQPLPMPDPRDVDFRGYIGSIAFDTKGDFIAAASPRGSVLGFWSSAGAWCGALSIADVCGITAGVEPNTFWASSGHGGIYNVAIDKTGPRVLAQWHADAGFDNHLLLI